ncbi:hypothetical protein [Candidatus Mycoplasma haematohominis]|uniref:Uncharacterized protein n=1 Tax=Candidatus Mycoplasma haematohominis TaxID=1494318 RepID=A0A478FTZ5_9MOLU|nr:hypothetical protein [Candidatus Mycoplasma haemohominis]GCE63510.1 hypothetical protein MHSWG343_05070 [Candidatus Mycoplasma haemohominis]
MVPAAKGGIALVLLAATSTGGYFLFNSQTGEVKHPVVLSSRDNLTNSYAAEKFGNIYSIYMVDPNNEENKWWWEKVYGDFQKDLTNDSKKAGLSTEFTSEKINKAYSSSSANGGNTALNQVCDVAFKKNSTELNNPANYENNVWAYCSIVNAKYKFVDIANAGNKLISDAQHKNKAVSAENSDNSSFWDKRNKEFFGEANKAGTGVKSSVGSIFETLYKSKSSTPSTSDNIKQKCQESYNLEKTGSNTPPKATHEDIKKFCYLIPE